MKQSVIRPSCKAHITIVIIIFFININIIIYNNIIITIYDNIIITIYDNITIIIYNNIISYGCAGGVLSMIRQPLSNIV